MNRDDKGFRLWYLRAYAFSEVGHSLQARGISEDRLYASPAALTPPLDLVGIGGEGRGELRRQVYLVLSISATFCLGIRIWRRLGSVLMRVSEKQRDDDDPVDGCIPLEMLARSTLPQGEQLSQRATFGLAQSLGMDECGWLCVVVPLVSSFGGWWSERAEENWDDDFEFANSPRNSPVPAAAPIHTFVHNTRSNTRLRSNSNTQGNTNGNIGVRAATSNAHLRAGSSNTRIITRQPSGSGGAGPQPRPSQARLGQPTPSQGNSLTVQGHTRGRYSGASTGSEDWDVDDADVTVRKEQPLRPSI
ncbi:4492_t:CDS:2, partial [Acaulospora colombiana]